MENNTRGGLLLQNLLTNLASKELLGIPLFLSPLGVAASQQLVDMLNLLPIDNSSSFIADNRLFEFLQSSVGYDYTYNLELNLNKLIPIKSYNLPLKNQHVINGTDAGVYAFVHQETGYVGLGSATSCRYRLESHIRSFIGKRDTTFLHDWVKNNGGLTSIRWAPIITLPNLEILWMKSNSSDELSAGSAKLLRAITQYPTRVLEQCLNSHYKPYLNSGNNSQIIFYNFAFSPSDMDVTSRTLDRYQALASDKATILAEAGSYNELAKYIGLSNVSVRNNMNWAKGTHFTFEGNLVEGYLRKFGST